MKIKSLLITIIFLVSSPVIAAEFPLGTFSGIGFVVEKGTLKMTHNDLYKYKSSITITKVKENVISTLVTATLQKSKYSRAKNDSRNDRFEVKWISDKKGTLVNKNKKYSNDKSEFLITDGKLTIKSWIARNQLRETHIYSLGEEPNK